MEDTGKKKKVDTGGTQSSVHTSQDDLKNLSMSELNTLLGEVLEQEDYLRAIAIRDEINSRKV
jgi:protein-arginine kinase activator protein McsA